MFLSQPFSELAHNALTRFLSSTAFDSETETYVCDLVSLLDAVAGSIAQYKQIAGITVPIDGAEVALDVYRGISDADLLNRLIQDAETLHQNSIESLTQYVERSNASDESSALYTIGVHLDRLERVISLLKQVLTP